MYKSMETMRKIANAYEPYRVKCKCGHTLTISPQSKRLICRYCGKWVYLNEEDEKEFKKEEIKKKMRRLLNERTIY